MLIQLNDIDIHICNPHQKIYFLIVICFPKNKRLLKTDVIYEAKIKVSNQKENEQRRRKYSELYINLNELNFPCFTLRLMIFF